MPAFEKGANCTLPDGSVRIDVQGAVPLGVAALLLADTGMALGLRLRRQPAHWSGASSAVPTGNLSNPWALVGLENMMRRRTSATTGVAR
jgi:hypothetical protein